MSHLSRLTHRVFFASVALVLAILPASADDIEKNILTGGPTGTYIQFGNDIAGLMGECGQTLNVRESAGSLENFLGVRSRRVTQFGIVQSDVLEYLQTYSADDPNIRRAIAGVRIALPLYNEEVHILAKRSIQSTADLAGKRVAIGVEDSGTFLTASLLLDLIGVELGEALTIRPDESMSRLLSGDIDAFFYVAGAPTSIFQTSEIDPAQFHFVPITEPVLQAVYTSSQIPGGTYPFQQGDVPVVAVKAVLMTYEYNRAKNAYHRNSCRAVSDVTNLIVTQFQRLQQSGHPKWKQVDLNDIPPGWDVSACVNEGLAENYEMMCDRPAPAAQNAVTSAANTIYRQRICATIGC